MSLTPVITDDGSSTLFSEKFDVTYHSLQGAIDESITVFLSAGLERLVLDGFKSINILEIGFGTGLNALLTLHRSRNLIDISIQYTGVEAYPVPMNIIESLQFPSLLSDNMLKEDFTNMHEATDDKPLTINNFSFIKQTALFESLSYKNRFNLIYFDAFAPTTQPELWEVDLLSKMYDALQEKAILVTYCAKGSFKRNLKLAGFQVEALLGPGRKREITRAWKSPHVIENIKSKLKF